MSRDPYQPGHHQPRGPRAEHVSAVRCHQRHDPWRVPAARHRNRRRRPCRDKSGNQTITALPSFSTSSWEHVGSWPQDAIHSALGRGGDPLAVSPLVIGTECRWCEAGDAGSGGRGTRHELLHPPGATQRRRSRSPSCWSTMTRTWSGVKRTAHRCTAACCGEVWYEKGSWSPGPADARSADPVGARRR